MKKSSANSTAPTPNKWRAILVGFLIGVGTIALANWLILRWLNVYVFDTQNYVKTVAPLTKNSDVSSALSKYATEKLYSTIDLEAEIKQALPEKAAFIAPPLASQVVSATEKIGTNLIASDQFNGIWISANEAAHSRLLTTLKQPQAEFNAQKERVVFGVNITPFIEKIRDRLQSSGTGTISNNLQNSQAAEVAVNLRERIQDMRLAYQYTQALYVILPMLFAAAYIGAIAVSRQRWKTGFSITLTVVVITAIELILLKAARPEIIGDVATAYQSAAGVIWDALTAGFKNVTTNTLIISVVASIIMIFAGPFAWAKKLRHVIGLDKFAGTRLCHALTLSRAWLRKNILSWRVAGVVLAFVALILKPSITWQTIVQAMLAYCIYVSVVELLATRKR